MSALLAAALDYAAKRLPVFPCVANGKLPAIARGFHSATTNPETIKRYWRAPDRNIGIPTGAVSGFWVLDVDGDNGEANLFALEAKHGRLPPTREVITGGGGRHLWFVYTGPIQSSVGKIAPGIDTRGDGWLCRSCRRAFMSPAASIIGPSTPRTSWRPRPHGWCNWRARSQRSGRSAQFLSRHSRASGRGTRDRQMLMAALRSIERSTLSPLRCRAPATTRSIAQRSVCSNSSPAANSTGTQVIERLIDACHRNGLVADDGWKTVMATIHSGMGAGLQHPRSRSGAA